jgi:hypothetical protein
MALFFTMGHASSCKNLPPAGDVICISYIQPFGITQWVEYHKTRVYKYNSNLEFDEPIVIPYSFGERQPLMFRIYNILPTANSPQFFGLTTCTLAQIISSGKVRLKHSVLNMYLTSQWNSNHIVQQVVQLQLEKLHSGHVAFTASQILISAKMTTISRSSDWVEWISSENRHRGYSVQKIRIIYSSKFTRPTRSIMTSLCTKQRWVWCYLCKIRVVRELQSLFHHDKVTAENSSTPQ